jgi:hypothetical protein
LQITFEVGAQTSGVWQISKVQLETGGVATPFEEIPTMLDVALCQRYFQWLPFAIGGGAPFAGVAHETQITFPVSMRVTPTVSAVAGDPNQVPGGSNFGSPAFQRITRDSATIYGIPGAVGGYFFVGCRASADAEIP